MRIARLVPTALRQHPFSENQWVAHVASTIKNFFLSSYRGQNVEKFDRLFNGRGYDPSDVEEAGTGISRPRWGTSRLGIGPSALGEHRSKRPSPPRRCAGTSGRILRLFLVRPFDAVTET